MSRENERLVKFVAQTIDLYLRNEPIENDEALAMRIGWTVEELRTKQVRYIVDYSCKGFTIGNQTHMLVANSLPKTSPLRALLVTVIFFEVRRREESRSHFAEKTVAQRIEADSVGYLSGPRIPFTSNEVGDEPTPNP
jgi:hypothetical protein